MRHDMLVATVTFVFLVGSGSGCNAVHWRKDFSG